MDSITVKAYAKVNMSLAVKEKLPDGYHGIETLFRGISLWDTLVLTKNNRGMELHCDAPREWGLPEGRENLAWQAAELLRSAYPKEISGVKMQLHKAIPLDAGLGGGSADAAAVLLGLDRLFALKLDEENLGRFAAQLGSDVSFCLHALAAVGHGRGDELMLIPPGAPLWVLLIKPSFGLSAKDVYACWDGCNDETACAGEGATVCAEEASACAGDEASGCAGDGKLAHLLAGLQGDNPARIWENMFNDLEESAFRLEGRLRAYRQWVEEAMLGLAGDREGKVLTQVGKIMLCGSGSTLAAFFAKEGHARLLEKKLRETMSQAPEGESPQLFLARTLTPADLAERFA